MSRATGETVLSRQHDYPVIVSRASGCRVWDTADREYLDFAASNSPLGHSHPAITAALAGQCATLDSAPFCFRSEVHAQAVSAIRSFFGCPKALIFDSVSAAFDAVAHIARRWIVQEGRCKSEESIILYSTSPAVASEYIDLVGTLDAGGYSYGTGSYQWHESERNARQNEFLPRWCVPFDDIQALEEVISEPRIGALIMEPIRIDSGLLFARDSYLQKAAELCKQNNVMFVVDERRTGVGRTGKPFYCDYFSSIQPDAVLLGQSLTGGAFPFSCLLPRGVAAELLSGLEEVRVAGYSSSALACAAARATVEVFKEEKDLLKNCASFGTDFRKRLKRRIPKVDNSLVRAVRGKGLLSCMVIGEDDGTLAHNVAMKMAQEGILAPCAGNVIFLTPPLSISEGDLRTAALVIRKCIQQVAKAHGRLKVDRKNVKSVSNN